MNFTPKARILEEEELVSLIRAIQSDINNPLRLQESIARDEAQIVTLQNSIIAAKERQAQLPQLLESFKAQLVHLRTHKSRTITESKIDRLKKLREEMMELMGEMNGNA